MLVEILCDESFLAGEVSTDFFERRPAVLEAGTQEPDPTLLFAACVMRAEAIAARRRVQRGIPVGWRNVTALPHRTTFATGAGEHVVEWFGGAAGYRPADPDSDIEVLTASADAVHLRVGGVSAWFAGLVTDDRVYVDGPGGSLALRVVPRFVDPADQVAEGSLLAPMPGSVVRLAAAAGDEVSEGQTILVMEAMKMQHTVAAPYAGIVTELSASEGEQVEAGAVLAVVTPADEATSDSEGENA